MTRFRLGLAFFLAVLVSIWARPALVSSQRGEEAERFVTIASESAARPIHQWPELTLHGEHFSEHPPLGLVLESLAFRAFGSGLHTAIRLTQLYATLLALIVLSVPLALGAGRSAQYALVGLLCLPGFWSEAQNPVLEMPLTLAFAGSTLAAAGLYRICTRDAAPGLALAAWNSVAFAFASSAVFLLDGPKALACFVPLGYLAWRLPRLRPYAAFASVLALLAAALLAGIYELGRVANNLSPFFPDYLRAQWQAPDLQPLAFLRPFSRWYGAIFPALGVLAWRTWKRPDDNPLAMLSVLWCGTILLTFPIRAGVPEWYVHPVMPGVAWLVGEAFAEIVAPRYERAVALVTAVLALAIALFL